MMLHKRTTDEELPSIVRLSPNLPVSLFVFIFVLLLSNLPAGESISCYTCSSWNHTDPGCHDPYNPANSRYTRDCMVPKKNHMGHFPAYFCLKIIGRKEVTGEQLVIRACIMENMDNQCGMFGYEDSYFQGCILTCDYNGCNDSNGLRSSFITILVFVTTVTVLVFGTSPLRNS